MPRLSNTETVMQGVSIVICCHNSANRLPETLRHLGCQSVPESLNWEVIMVDNASTDGTSGSALNACPSLILNRIRIVQEKKPGKSNALNKGIAEAQYSIISIIDDDNWVPTDWISKVGKSFEENQTIDILGCSSEAVFETVPPVWFMKISGFYAIGEQYNKSGDITDCSGALLWGAGMSIRKTSIKELKDTDFTYLLSSTNGKAVGEDTELCYAVRANGGRIWYLKELKIYHFIPSERLTWEYACKLMRGMGEASGILTIYLIALHRAPFDPHVVSIKKTWMYQFLKSLKNLMKIMLAHPILCFQKTEGRNEVLEYQKTRGEILALLAIRSRYKSMINQITNAGWNHGGEYL